VDVRLWMTIEIEDLHRRLEKIECQRTDEVLTLVELLANISFFGDMKKANCVYAKNGQCGFFVVNNEAKGTIPVSGSCRIEECQELSPHRHIELTNVTCALCDMAKELTVSDNDAQATKKKGRTKKQY
jgi:hypothetical protein